MKYREVLGKKYSLRVLNKKIPMTKYLKIAEEQGIDAAMDELERDWQHRVISRTTYYRNKKLLEELRYYADYEKLFMNFLKLLAESDREKFSKDELAVKLGVNPITIDNLIKWMKETGFAKIAQLVSLGKKALKSGKKAVQSSAIG